MYENEINWRLELSVIGYVYNQMMGYVSTELLSNIDVVVLLLFLM